MLGSACVLSLLLAVVHGLKIERGAAAVPVGDVGLGANVTAVDETFVISDSYLSTVAGIIDHKYYVRGIGEVSEETFKGPLETSKLVSVSGY